MKKVYYAMVFSIPFFLMACTNSASNTTADNSDSTQSDILAKNRSIYTAIETGDTARINSLIASDAVDHEGPKGQDIKGRDSISHMLADMHNHMKDMKFEVLADAVKGDYVFAMVKMTGTTTDSSFGMPAGTKMDGKSVDVVKVSNGKMVEHWGFFDPNDMMKQMQAMQGNKK